MKKPRSEAQAAAAPEGISPELIAALEAAAGLPDDQIDTSDPDAPEVLDWTVATRGRFYKPLKVQKTLRLDADLLAFYEGEGPGHLSRMNQDLRVMMLHRMRRNRRILRTGGPSTQKKEQTA